MKLTGRHNLIIASVFVLGLLIYFAMRKANDQAITILEESSGGETKKQVLEGLSQGVSGGDYFGVGLGAWILKWFY